MTDPSPRFYEPDSHFDSEGGDRELYEVGNLLKAAAIPQFDDPHFGFEHESSHELKDRLRWRADALEYGITQFEAIVLEDSLEENIRNSIIRELEHVHTHLCESLETPSINARKYLIILIDNRAYSEEALIMFNFLKIAHGAYLSETTPYINEKCEFGFSDKNRFQVDPLLAMLESARIAITEALSDQYNFDSGGKNYAIQAGRNIKSVLETIIQSIDTTNGDPVEKVFRLISVKLEDMLDIILAGFNLPKNKFRSKIFEQIRRKEREGGYCLERVENGKPDENTPISMELDDAIKLMKLAQRIAKRAAP